MMKLDELLKQEKAFYDTLLNITGHVFSARFALLHENDCPSHPVNLEKIRRQSIDFLRSFLLSFNDDETKKNNIGEMHAYIMLRLQLELSKIASISDNFKDKFE